MEGHGVVDLRPDPGGAKRLANSVTAWHADRVLVEDVPAFGRAGRNDNAAGGAAPGKQPIVPLGVAAAALGPALEVRQLHPQHRRLKRIEPEVPADTRVEVLRVRAV